MNLDQVARPYARAAEKVSQTLGDAVSPPPDEVTEPRTPRFGELDSLLWTLQRKIRNELGVTAERDVVADLLALGEERETIEEALLAWIDLTAHLMQAAQDRHRDDRGAGPLKRAEVQAGVARAIGRRVAPFDHLPVFARPFVAGPATGWLVDALHLLANRYDLWSSEAPPRGGRAARIRARIRAVGRRGAHAVGALLAATAALARAIAAGCDRRALALRGLDGGDMTGRRGCPRPAGSMSRTTEALAGLADRGDDLVGAVALVGYAVETAEARPDLPPARREALAAKLVLLVVDDLGFDLRSPLNARVARTLTLFAVRALRPYLCSRSLLVTRGS